jgi:hypothetical protein
MEKGDVEGGMMAQGMGKGDDGSGGAAHKEGDHIDIDTRG